MKNSEKTVEVTKFDVTSQEQYNTIYSGLQIQLRHELENIPGISPALFVRLSARYVDIGVCEMNPSSSYYGGMAFGTEINISYNNRRYSDESEKTFEINYGTTGSFSIGDTNPVLRTFNAACILTNWDKVTRLVKKYCDNIIQLQEDYKAYLKTQETTKEEVK